MRELGYKNTTKYISLTCHETQITFNGKPIKIMWEGNTDSILTWTETTMTFNGETITA